MLDHERTYCHHSAAGSPCRHGRHNRSGCAESVAARPRESRVGPGGVVVELEFLGPGEDPHIWQFPIQIIVQKGYVLLEPKKERIIGVIKKTPF